MPGSMLNLAGLVRPASGGGFHWRVLPSAVAIFGEEVPDPDRWRREGLASTIKAGLQRTIERVDLPGGAVVAKTCRVNGPRAWWREVFRGSKAKLEFENARLLLARGVAAAEPLAWGRAHRLWPSTSVYVSRRADGLPLVELLEGGATFDHRALAIELGRTLARMHDAGVAHPDPHPGNLLVSRDGDRFAFTLIDLHSLRIGPPLNWADSLDNLVLFNRYFQIRASRSDRLAFWRAYLAQRTARSNGGIDPKAMAKEAERRTLASNARFWASRLDRYRKTNRQYRRLKGPGVFGHAVNDLPKDFVERLLADPDAPFRDPSAVVLKNSRSSTVIELPTPAGIAIYKRFRVKSSIILLKNRLRTSSALRSWDFGHNLLDRGLPTARPLVVLHRRRMGCPAEGYLLTERVPEARELSSAVAAGAKRSWADSLGRLIRLMHDKQVAHRDLKAPNVLMSGDEPVLIDLVGVVPGKPVGRRLRMKNLARLNASFLDSPNVSRTDRLRFLRAYLAWGLRGRAGWKDWWIGVARETSAKVEKNRKSGRPLA